MSKSATVIALSALLALGTGVASADDKPRRGKDRGDRIEAPHYRSDTRYERHHDRRHDRHHDAG